MSLDRKQCFRKAKVAKCPLPPLSRPPDLPHKIEIIPTQLWARNFRLSWFQDVHSYANLFSAGLLELPEVGDPAEAVAKDEQDHDQEADLGKSFYPCNSAVLQSLKSLVINPTNGFMWNWKRMKSNWGRKVERLKVKDSDQKFAQGDSQEKPKKCREKNTIHKSVHLKS